VEKEAVQDAMRDKDLVLVSAHVYAFTLKRTLYWRLGERGFGRGQCYIVTLVPA
jgi:hypothetical protein